MSFLQCYTVVKVLTKILFYMKCYRDLYKIFFGQRFYMPIKLQKIAFNS